MTRYTVIFKNTLGRLRKTTCVVTEGYSTVADIPKMITIKYGDACTVVGMINEDLTSAERRIVIDALMFQTKG